MELDPNMKRFHFACFHCRKMVRKTLPKSRYRGVKNKRDILNCAECVSQLAFVGRYFEPPRQHNLKAWKQLELRHTQPNNWFAPYDGDRRIGPAKYYAKLPRQVVEQRQQQDERCQLDCAKQRKKQQRLQKQQERLASRSRPRRSLTNFDMNGRYAKSNLLCL